MRNVGIILGALLLGIMVLIGDFDLLSHLEWPGQREEVQATKQQTPKDEIVEYINTERVRALVLQIEEADPLITGMERPEGTRDHVQDILSLSVRKEIYFRDREARSEIGEYVDRNYPIDVTDVFAGDERTLDLNWAVWDLLYVRHEQEVCHEYGIPEWMLFQILREGDQHFWWSPEQ